MEENENIDTRRKRPYGGIMIAAFLLSIIYAVIRMAVTPETYEASCRVGVRGNSDELVERLLSDGVFEEVGRGVDLPALWEMPMDAVANNLSWGCRIEIEEEGKSLLLFARSRKEKIARAIVNDWVDAFQRSEAEKFEVLLKVRKDQYGIAHLEKEDLYEHSLRNLNEAAGLLGASIEAGGRFGQNDLDRLTKSLSAEEQAEKKELIEKVAEAMLITDQREDELKVIRKQVATVPQTEPSFKIVSGQTLSTREVSGFEYFWVDIGMASVRGILLGGIACGLAYFLLWRNSGNAAKALPTLAKDEGDVW